jgi:hypothetical protein
LSAREIAILTPLVAFTIILGVYPKIVFDATSVSVAHLVAQEKSALGTLPTQEAKLELSSRTPRSRDPGPSVRSVTGYAATLGSRFRGNDNFVLRSP